jgi:signal transduction histidine kinase
LHHVCIGATQKSVQIATRLALGLTATSALVLGAYGYRQLQQEQRDLHSVAEQQLRVLGTALQVGIENALRDEQKADVGKILDSLEVRDSTLDVFVFDPAGRLDAQSWGSEASREAAGVLLRELGQAGGRSVLRYDGDRTTRLIAAFPLVRDDGSSAGAVAVVKPLDDLRNDLETTRRSLLASLLSQLAGISLVGWVLVLVYVRRPLVTVIEGMRAVRRGDLSARVASRHRDEVADVAAEFNRMVADLETTRVQLAAVTESRRALEAGLQRVDKLVTVGQLSAGLAHEIGSPLQILSGRARALLERSDASAEIRRNAEILVAQSERVARIVEQLLGFSRRRTLHLSMVDLQAAIQAVLDLLEHEARRRRVTLEFLCPPGTPALGADADQLQQAVLNLVNNALKATPPAGVVRIAVTSSSFSPGAGVPARPSLELVVEDTGAGMDEGQLGRAFEPFFTSWPDGQGTGLGLAVVKAIVTDHGGTVTLTSKPGGGTRAILHLPLAGPAAIPAAETA